MKKLMIAAAAMMAGVAMADVESANVVGYTTETLAGGRWLIAQVGFQTTAGEDFDLQDLIQGIQTVNIQSARGYTGWKEGDAPRIQLQKRDANGVITGNGNDTYYYLANAGLDQRGTVTAPGWANGSGYRLGTKGTNYTGTPFAAAVKVKPGTAFWYQDPADSTITFAGQVLSPNQIEIFVPAGKWGLVCNPFPMAIELNDNVKITYAGLKDDVSSARGYTGWKEGDAPRVQIQKRGADGTITGNGNDIYYYLANAGLDQRGNVTAPGWANGSGYRLGVTGTDYAGTPFAAAVTIPAGGGFWFQNPETDCTITFSK